MPTAKPKHGFRAAFPVHPCTLTEEHRAGIQAFAGQQPKAFYGHIEEIVAEYWALEQFFQDEPKPAALRAALKEIRSKIDELMALFSKTDDMTKMEIRLSVRKDGEDIGPAIFDPYREILDQLRSMIVTTQKDVKEAGTRGGKPPNTAYKDAVAQLTELFQAYNIDKKQIDACLQAVLSSP